MPVRYAEAIDPPDNCTLARFPIGFWRVWPMFFSISPADSFLSWNSSEIFSERKSSVGKVAVFQTDDRSVRIDATRNEPTDSQWNQLKANKPIKDKAATSNQWKLYLNRPAVGWGAPLSAWMVGSSILNRGQFHAISRMDESAANETWDSTDPLCTSKTTIVPFDVPRYTWNTGSSLITI